MNYEQRIREVLNDVAYDALSQGDDRFSGVDEEATQAILQLLTEARIEELETWLKAAENQKIESIPVGPIWYRIEELKAKGKQ